MKNKIISIFCAVLFVFIFQFCDNKKNEAIEYNDKIVGEQMSIVNKMIEFTQTFQDVIPEVMDSKLTELKLQIQNSLDVLNAMEAYEGDSELLNAAKDLFKFYQKMADNEFKEMLNILKKGESITEQDYFHLIDMQEIISQQEAVYDQNMATAQSNFAKKYDIKIENNTVQEKINNMEN